MTFHIFIDGASRGNPGPSSIGVVIRNTNGNTLREHSRCIGTFTNNVAEYTALLDALRLAKELGGTRLRIHSDSQLLVRQFDGTYKVKNARLQKYLLQIRSLEQQFTSVELVHVPREENKDADRLANVALDSPP